MTQEELVGKVQTVLGLIDAESLGITMAHEHVLCDVSAYFVEPTEASERKLAHEPIRMDNLCWVRNHCSSHLDDMKLTDEQVAIKEVMLLKMAGGNTIVDMTCIGLHRDPLGLCRVSRATGVNIVMGAGYYVALSHPPELADMSEEKIAEGIVRDIMVGVGDTGVRAGIIGEIGCSLPLEENERKVLRACAVAQRRTGVAINIHPSPSDDLALEIIKILDDAGADLSRTVISHVHPWGFSRTTLHTLADAGCYIEYDSFGQPHAGIHPLYFGLVLDFSSAVRRIEDIMQLIADGYLNHILVSQDVCFKHHLVTYGGCGYAHILRDVVPFMRHKGMSDEQIHTLLVENPKRVFPFAPVKD
jgi:phosphotriesterase-related protein